MKGPGLLLLIFSLVFILCLGTKQGQVPPGCGWFLSRHGSVCDSPGLWHVLPFPVLPGKVAVGAVCAGAMWVSQGLSKEVQSVSDPGPRAGGALQGTPGSQRWP